jgi:L-amino acid N-acyltransferase YncA
MTAARIEQVLNNDGNTVTDALTMRDALPDDMPSVQRIYAHHVTNTTATFEETPPTEQEMQRRRLFILDHGLPYLVAQREDRIVGYAYATPYRTRPAYRYTIEDSIYLAHDIIGKGIGNALLAALIERCEQGPWRQMIAVIAGIENTGSINLHRKMGFTHAGTQVATGYKFKQWIDVVFMQRALSGGSLSAPDENYRRPGE